MRIQTKLVIATVFAVGVTAFAVSLTSLRSTQSSELNRVDRDLLKVTFVENPDSADLISPAIKAAEQTGKKISVSVISPDGYQLQLDERKKIDLSSVPRTTLRASTKEPTTIYVEDVPYRISAINLGGGSFITAVFSLKYLDEIYDENLQSFLRISFIALVIAGTFIGYMVRRELKEIEKVVEFSEVVSQGNLAARFEGRNRSPEILQLTSSLNRMISSLTKAINKERELQNSMKDFLGDASHELKTPLTVIKGYNELLISQRQSLSEESITSAHSNITTQIERMEALVKDLLLLTEIETSSEIAFQDLNFSELLRLMVEEFGERNPGRELQENIESGIWITGSERLISRMVANILRNIEVHTPVQAAVEVELQQSENQAVLRISDAGPGLPADSYGRGIQGFQRFDASRSRETGGTGLGMSIIGSVVTRHGGQIELRQGDLGGLEIEIRLALTPSAVS